MEVILFIATCLRDIKYRPACTDLQRDFQARGEKLRIHYTLSDECYRNMSVGLLNSGLFFQCLFHISEFEETFFL